jgi:hypothetical protein
MCGLPLFPPKPNYQNSARTRRTFRWPATWERGAKRVNRMPKEADADRPAGSQFTPGEHAGLFLKARGEPQ